MTLGHLRIDLHRFGSSSSIDDGSVVCGESSKLGVATAASFSAMTRDCPPYCTVRRRVDTAAMRIADEDEDDN